MKQFHYFALQILILFTAVFSSACQSSTSFAGVYAGVKLSLNPLGGGMNRTDKVILFRKDKTFTDELDKKDWKTAVRGRYEIKGSDLILRYTNGDKDEYTITKAGNLDGGNYVMFKMNLDNSVPKGTYVFKFISGSGGIATGTTYVGTSTRENLSFDGAGNFTTDRQSNTVIAGNNIGGGTNANSDGSGKYSVKDGILILKYSDGKTTTHSFFASAASGKSKAMAVIDGSFYFMGEEDNNRSGSSDKQINSKLPSAGEIFTRVRKVYGGDALDQLKTYTINAALGPIELTSYNDLVGKRFRNEMLSQGKLIAIEQIGQGEGWLWNKGIKTSSDQQRLLEAKYNDYTGVLGLREINRAVFSKGTVEQTRAGYRVEFEAAGLKFNYFFDNNYNLLGDSWEIGKQKQANSYSNNRIVDGIRMPFRTVSSSGNNKVIIIYKSILINKPLSTNWKEPR